MSYRKTIGASLFALGMAVAAPAMAAMDSAPASQSVAAGHSTSTQAFPDAKLNSYAVANVTVEQLNQQYAARAQATTDATAKQQIEQEKNAKLAETVTQAGLTVDEYNQIYMASKADTALAAKIASLKAPAGTAQPSSIQ